MGRVGPLACAVDPQGALKCTTDQFVVGEPVAAFAMNYWLTAVVTRSGDVLSWVASDWKTIEPVSNVPPSHRLHIDGRRFVDVMVSPTEFCAVDSDRRVWCWNYARFEPEEVVSPKPLASIVPCGEVFCGTLVDGQLVLVERDHLPQTNQYQVVAKPIRRALGFASGAYALEDLDSGRRLGCGIRRDVVTCEGDRTSELAERISSLGAGSRLIANQRLACVITPKRTVRCVTPEQDPFDLRCLHDVIDLTIEPDGMHGCARRADQTVLCFDLQGPFCSQAPVQLR